MKLLFGRAKLGSQIKHRGLGSSWKFFIGPSPLPGGACSGQGPGHIGFNPACEEGLPSGECVSVRMAVHPQCLREVWLGDGGVVGSGSRWLRHRSFGSWHPWGPAGVAGAGRSLGAGSTPRTGTTSPCWAGLRCSEAGPILLQGFVILHRLGLALSVHPQRVLGLPDGVDRPTSKS